MTERSIFIRGGESRFMIYCKNSNTTHVSGWMVQILSTTSYKGFGNTTHVSGWMVQILSTTSYKGFGNTTHVSG
ncbi:MAG TPA: hypothetical protein VFH91_03510, partial [Pyrinomonadaceae bacterium]|nr:hypothetical protein [Pyrinomonadaceae bacterium]